MNGLWGIAFCNCDYDILCIFPYFGIIYCTNIYIFHIQLHVSNFDENHKFSKIFNNIFYYYILFLNQDYKKVCILLDVHFILVCITHFVRFLLIYSFFSENLVSWALIFTYLILSINSIFRILMTLGRMISNKLSSEQKKNIIYVLSDDTSSNLETDTNNPALNKTLYRFTRNNYYAVLVGLGFSCILTVCAISSVYHMSQANRVAEKNLQAVQQANSIAEKNLQAVQQANIIAEKNVKNIDRDLTLQSKILDCVKIALENEQLQLKNNATISTTSSPEELQKSITQIAKEHSESPGDTTLMQKIDGLKKKN